MFFAMPVCLLITLTGFVTQAPSPAELFPDKNLAAAVREHVLDKRGTDKPLVEQDVANLSTITAKGKGIRDLTGLDKCKRLASLDLVNNEITDLAPVKDLKILQYLDLANNKINDLTPLKDLTGLQYLDLTKNEIADAAPLQGLKALTTLMLSNNKLTDGKPLADLKKLWSLYLDGNQITDVSFVKDVKGLSTLSLRENRVSSLSPLAGLTELRFLFLEKNKITDLNTLLFMAKGDQKEMRFAPYWYVDLTGNPLSATAKTTQLAKLKTYGGRILYGTPPTAKATASKARSTTGSSKSKKK